MKNLLEKTEDRYILRIDASSYRESTCDLRFYFTTVRGLRNNHMNHKMEYGTAYHKALEKFYATGDRTAAMNMALEHYSNPEIVVPETDWRTAGHLATCLTQYFDNYSEVDGLVVEQHNGEPLLEMKFAYPFYTNGTVDVLLCGTIDFIGKYFGQNIICDHKSTAITSVDRYLDSYRMSTQLMAYTMVLRKLFPDRNYQAIINGIFLSRSNKNKFQRSAILDFSQDRMEKFEEHLTNTVIDFADLIAKGIKTNTIPFLPNFNCCETKFGMCRFADICNSGEHSETIIDNEYYTKLYDPLQFQT